MSIFSDPNVAVQSILRDRLTLLALDALPEADLDPDFVLRKLAAAEADCARQLKVYFEPTKILPDDTDQATLDALDEAETPYALESPRDLDADFFMGDRWGDIALGSRPAISVEQVQFAYPLPGQPFLTIPADWLRLDRRAGYLRIVPISSLTAMQMATFRTNLMGAGRMLPSAVRVSYTAGLRNAETKYPDLVDVIMKMAVLRIVEDMFFPTSGSISADGLSQSLSVDVSKYQDAVDRKLFGPKGSNGGLYTDIHGIQMGVL